MKNNEPVYIDNQHFIQKQGANGEHALIIKDANKEDAGKFSAKATNKAGSAETKANFGVIEDVEAPHFVERLKELEAKEHDDLRLECKVVGKPEPQISWLKDGVPVHIDQNRIISQTSADGKQILILKDVTKADAGRFSCVATNKAGEDKTDANLKFPTYATEKQPEESIQPFFIEELKQQQVNEGETATLKCRVNPESKPEIQWLKDGRPITQSPNMIVEKLDDGTLKLTIMNAKKDDLGNYECRAVNPSGKASTNADLKYATQHEEPKFDEDIFIGFAKTLQDKTAIEGTKCVLECQLDSHTVKLPNLQIKWTRNANEPIPYLNSRTERLDDGTLRLILEPVFKNDVGKYKCTVSYEKSTVWTEAKLLVQGFFLLHDFFSNNILFLKVRFYTKLVKKIDFCI